MTRRKWIVLGGVAGMIVAAVCVAALSRVNGTLGRYSFLRGAELVSESEIVFEIGPSRTLTTHRTYALHANLDSIAPTIDAELKADGWTPLVPITSRHIRYYTRKVPPTAPSGAAGRSGSALFRPGMGMISITEGRPVVPPSTASSYSRQREPGWLTVTVRDPPRELGWVDGLMEKLTPSGLSSKRTTVKLGRSGSAVTLPSATIRAPGPPLHRKP